MGKGSILFFVLKELFVTLLLSLFVGNNFYDTIGLMKELDIKTKEKIHLGISNVEQKLESLQHIISRMAEVSQDYKDYLFLRDSLVRRFNYCTDAFLCVLREFIIEKHGVDVLASPKAVLKEAFDADLIDEKQYLQLLTSVNDRNLTSHAYQEDVALQIIEYVADSYQLMKIVIKKINQEINL